MRAEQTPADKQLAHATELNVIDQMHAITAHSDDLRTMANEGTIKIVGGIYHLADGSVEWLDAK